MTIEKSLEAKEKEPKKPLLILYRENDFLNKQVAKLGAVLGLDRKVEVQTFPPGTQKEIIDAWYENHKQYLAGKAVLTDKTCSRNINSEEIQTFPRKTLDSFFDDVAWYAMGAKVWDFNFLKEGIDIFKSGGIGEQDVENYKRTLREFFKLLFLNGMPKNIVILEKHLVDHFPILDTQKHMPREDSEIVPLLSKAIQDAGFPPERIRVVKSPEDLLEEYSGTSSDGKETTYTGLKVDSDDWILLDRHNLYGMGNLELQDLASDSKHIAETLPHFFKEGRQTHSAAVYISLPLGNAVSDARAFGILDFPEEVEDKYIKKLAEQFS